MPIAHSGENMPPMHAVEGMPLAPSGEIMLIAASGEPAHSGGNIPNERYRQEEECAPLVYAVGAPSTEAASSQFAAPFGQQMSVEYALTARENMPSQDDALSMGKALYEAG